MVSRPVSVLGQFISQQGCQLKALVSSGLLLAVSLNKKFGVDVNRNIISCKADRSPEQTSSSVASVFHEAVRESAKLSWRDNTRIEWNKKQHQRNRKGYKKDKKRQKRERKCQHRSPGLSVFEQRWHSSSYTRASKFSREHLSRRSKLLSRLKTRFFHQAIDGSIGTGASRQRDTTKETCRPLVFFHFY